MPIELLNPDGLPKPDVYRQVAVASGSRTVFLAGQVARTEAGEPVGAGDLAAQVEQAYLNVATAMAAVGGSFDDVAKLTLYIVDWNDEKAQRSSGTAAFCGHGALADDSATGGVRGMRLLPAAGSAARSRPRPPRRRADRAVRAWAPVC